MSHGKFDFGAFPVDSADDGSMGLVPEVAGRPRGVNTGFLFSPDVLFETSVLTAVPDKGSVAVDSRWAVDPNILIGPKGVPPKPYPV